jgi:hypothetical protein
VIVSPHYIFKKIGNKINFIIFITSIGLAHVFDILTFSNFNIVVSILVLMNFASYEDSKTARKLLYAPILQIFCTFHDFNLITEINQRTLS